MAKFYRNGAALHVFGENEILMDDHLPKGIYTISDFKEDLILKDRPSLFDYGPVYGRLKKDADRIFNTFMDRPGNTGVLLTGVQGTGKTKLARIVAKQCYDAGYPIITLGTAYNTNKVSEFLNAIDSDFVLIIDEFEKLYKSETSDDSEDNRPSQLGLLTAMDGIQNTGRKNLFILIGNEKGLINRYLFNRPGRIYYHFQYNSIDDETVEKYCEAHLKNKEYFKDIKELKTVSEHFTFDALQTLVEESNRYNISPVDALDYLNFAPFNAWLFKDGTMTVRFIVVDTTTKSTYAFQKYIDIGALVNGEGIDVSFTRNNVINIGDSTTYSKLEEEHIFHISKQNIVEIQTGGIPIYMTDDKRYKVTVSFNLNEDSETPVSQVYKNMRTLFKK